MILTMKIISWNIAGIRAKIKKGHLDFLLGGEYDVICWQETKAEEQQVKMPEDLAKIYPYRYWRACDGTDQRKGLSGTSIWSKTKPIREIDPMSLSISEGRITAVEFKNLIVVTVYTPNSQGPGTDRCLYRTCIWDQQFREWVNELNMLKPTVVCGDFNVANEALDVAKPEKWENKVAGFLDIERDNFKALLDTGWIDSYRENNIGAEKKFTYWNQRCPWERKQNIGWRIDYFLVPEKYRSWIKATDIHPDIMGSDHCPTSLEIKPKKKKRLKIVKSL